MVDNMAGCGECMSYQECKEHVFKVKNDMEYKEQYYKVKDLIST